MNELVNTVQQLPDTIEDLSRFVLIGTEKLNAVRAEIKAIKKAKLAQDVYEQKMQEQVELSYAILDASIKLGEFTQKIPRAEKGNQYTGKMVGYSAVTDQMPKEEKIKELGFNKRQVSEFETLAKNPELVEEAKQEAAAKGEPISRTKVISFIREKRKQIINSPEGADPNEYIIFCREVANNYSNVIYSILTIPTTDECLNAWLEMLDTEAMNPDHMISKINEAMEYLETMRTFLINNRKKVKR